ncbi:hypothetical protein [Streptomyces justiciae]|uniref:hypothetical protein n=1 Tax=Streptomyces justiciae TaxID=2780140 RepID=UPI002119044E|nr:hypothetical protein [Streptomyces justiciae]MCW8383942.1 hypothetical protein [Streptomyces justiciae]
MDPVAHVKAVQANLAEFSARLTALDAHPAPADDRQKWHHLCQRHTLLRGLIEDTQQLAAAHEAADDLTAAQAVTELTEHYTLQAAHARRDLDIHKPRMARVIRGTIPRQPGPHQSHHDRSEH